jgi:quercetin dioxygenase-like cupin family protein
MTGQPPGSASAPETSATPSDVGLPKRPRLTAATLRHLYVAAAILVVVVALIAAAFNGSSSSSGSQQSVVPTGERAEAYYKRLVTIGRGLIVTPVGEGILGTLPKGVSTLSDGTRFRLSLDQPTQVTFLKITIVPGASIPWHHHSIPIIGVLISGKLIDYRANRPGCAPKVLRAGSAVFEPNTQVHTMINPFKEPAVFYVVAWSPHNIQPTLNVMKPSPGCPAHPK